ncbi:MAG: AAA family ATPase [Parcubacteria group bacterium]|jgi:chromosome segregation protein
MFLKRLEINGFKSFASKTTLDFLIDSENHKTHGITVVVGPNGSGKSNIADSLRWVMGEQSMKHLRGKKSEDIIFAGSGKKARLGSAKVTLYLDNCDQKIPIDFSEVTIARKINRSGEGEYFINGSRVRLQDITDLLAKAGVGKESYAIINQGMADAILAASPLERRTIIEDAAGVKQYQIKKERSIRKLDSTRENLERVKSLVEEIKPHLRMLKRQSDKAAKSEEIFTSLKEKQIKLFSHLWHNFRDEKQIFDEKKDELGREMMNMQREVDKLLDAINAEEKNNKENETLAGLEKDSREARVKYNTLERELIITEGRLEIEKEKQASRQVLEEIKITSIPVDSLYVKKIVEEIRIDQERLIEKLQKVEKIEELQDIKEFARAIQQRLFELKADIEKGKKEQNSESEALGAAPRASLSDASEIKKDNSVILELQNKLVQLRKDIKDLENKIREIDESREKEITEDRNRRQKFFEIERKMRTKQDELGKLKDQFNDAKISLARVEVREEDLRTDVKSALKIEPEELSKNNEEINREELEREVARLKIQLEQIGGIDPMVIDEYRETQKRFDFLSTESEDLEKAIGSLREIIKEMEQKISKEFELAFTEINKEFTKYFKIIFGGGAAHLTKVKVKNRKFKIKKTEEESDLETENIEQNGDDNVEDVENEKDEIGIDIFACPPGKRITSHAMLSGGERSLTSLALLFAVIAHNPPPFSILDEVEAALDEANSRRFGRILSELSKNTQFVIITHNRETMRQASMLYGVTMGEDGISKLLSVRLDQVGQGGKIIK